MGLRYDRDHFPPTSGEHVFFGFSTLSDIGEYIDDKDNREKLGSEVGSDLINNVQGNDLSTSIRIAHELALRTPGLNDYENLRPFMGAVLQASLDELDDRPDVR